ncbi:MAG: UDP-3-O-(3-hydroxymyristoyl)glucosamine N-acyltransferase [Bryobacteraceae bacterium]
MKVRELAAWLGAPFEGEGDRDIESAAAVETAGANQLSFAAGKRAAELTAGSNAGCLLVPPDLACSRTLIRVADPRAAFARAVARLHPPETPPAGIHPSAVIGDNVSLGARVSIAAHAVIESGAVIGDGSSIGAGCSVGRRVKLGADCRLYPRVTVYADTEIGNRAVLHSGCVIGADGFGFALVGDRYHKFPQVGKVRLGDDVEVGANSCIDRATLGVTEIGDGTKLDNMVHIAHNCRIGKHVVIAAQTGMAGGVIVEDYAIIGGQVGFGDKARVESRAVIGSGAGILTSKIVRAGEPVWGTPARPLRQYLEQLANMARVPQLRERVRALEKKVAELSDALGGRRP